MKKLFVLIFVLVFTLGLCSCGEKKVVIKEVASEITSTVKFEDKLAESDRETAFKIYDIDEADVNECFVYVTSAATVDEFSVWEANDTEAAKRIESQIKTRIAEQTEVYSTYKPEQIKKLENALVKVKGRYVFYCVNDDTDNAEKIYGKFFG